MKYLGNNITDKDIYAQDGLATHNRYHRKKGYAESTMEEVPTLFLLRSHFFASYKDFQ